MKRKSSELLQEKIDILKEKQYNDIAKIKTSIHELQEHLRPSNLLKETLRDISGAGDLHVSALDTFISLGAGYFANVAFAGKSKNLGVKVLGYLLQFGVTKYLADHLEQIRDAIFRGWHKMRQDDKKRAGANS